MRSFEQPTGDTSDDDPPGPPSLTCDERTALVATTTRILWRIIWIVTERGAKPLHTIGLYCREVEDVYYAIHQGIQNRESVRIESIRHNIDGPLSRQTLELLNNKQLRELLTIANHELKQLTKRRKVE